MDALSLEQLEKIYESRQVSKPTEAPALNTVQTARQQALYDIALSLGVKAGLNNQLKNIQDLIGQNTTQLDKIYQFEPYLIYSRVVPPVITEARNLYNQSGDEAVRLSGAMYKIERQARIASVAPNWREYLNFPSAGRLATDTKLYPNNSEEKSLWSKAIRTGWSQGIEQANDMFKQGLDRLNRDYLGILRFHTFVQKGMVTLPVLASSNMAVTKNDKTLTINEELLRLTVLSDFQASPDEWKVKITASLKQSLDYKVTKTEKIAEKAKAVSVEER